MSKKTTHPKTCLPHTSAPGTTGKCILRTKHNTCWKWNYWSCETRQRQQTTHQHQQKSSTPKPHTQVDAKGQEYFTSNHRKHLPSIQGSKNIHHENQNSQLRDNAASMHFPNKRSRSHDNLWLRGRWTLSQWMRSQEHWPANHTTFNKTSRCRQWWHQHSTSR